MILYTILGILISGGDDTETSVEFFNPTTGHHCDLPSLLDERVDHTSDGLDLCGGLYTRTTCITLSSGRWVTSHALAEERRYHTSWSSEAGLILMGGRDTDTTETISEGEYGGKIGFTMQYSTWYQ